METLLQDVSGLWCNLISVVPKSDEAASNDILALSYLGQEWMSSVFIPLLPCLTSILS